MALNDKLKVAYAELGVTDEHFAKLEEVFTDAELQEKLAGGYMRNADYTKKTQELALERKKLEEERQQFNEGQDYLSQQMNSYKTDVEKRLNAALQAAADSDARGAALTSKLRAIAAQYGEDPDELLKDVQQIRKEPEKKTDPFDFDSIKDKVVTRDEYNNAAGAFYTFAPMIRDFERDYQREFGKEYEGSITELMRDASKEVQQLQARGVQTNLFDHIRNKLDFSGQKQRNAEAAKVKAEEERKAWETKTREEIERDLRSQMVAENPNAFKQQNNQEAWRQNLNAKARNKLPKGDAMDNFKHRQSVHAAYKEREAKHAA